MKEQKPTLRDISTIFPYEKNAKKHDNIKPLVNSIKRFGWRGNPIIVDKEGVIISGHGRRLAAIELGLTKVPVVVEDDMTAEEARAFRLADNRSAVGDYDNDLLKEELIDLGGFVDMLDGIFDKKELDFAVADLFEMNEDAFVQDLDTVMDEQRNVTNEKIDAIAEKPIALHKVMGFKDIRGSNSIYVTRFMAKIQAESGKTGEEAFIDFIRGLTGELIHV